MYERLKRLYDEGRITEAGLKNAVKKNWNKEKEMEEIIKEKR